ncbi:MAG: NAD/NADP octopine/nopaline dehydrogenase family protein, partial [bacterium]
HGSYTVAGDLALAGWPVRLWTRSRRGHEAVYQSGSIRLRGLGRQGEGRLEQVTENLEEAVRGAGIIFSMSPAGSQENIAARLAPFLEDGQILFLSPGSLGCCVFAGVFGKEGLRREIAIAEPGTLPYLTRKVEPAEVQVSGLAVRLPVGVYPARKTGETLAALREVFPAAHPVENALSVALLNVGPIIHSVLMLLSTAPIEHFPDWDIHNEGSTDAVKRAILAHDRERIAIREALGYTSHHYPFADHYDAEGEHEWMYGRKGHTELVKSEKWREALDFNHRYIQEDVKCNLALLASLGAWSGVATPIADALLTLHGVITGEDFRRTGRTLETLGLAGMSRKELDTVLNEGI